MILPNAVDGPGVQHLLEVILLERKFLRQVFPEEALPADGIDPAIDQSLSVMLFLPEKPHPLVLVQLNDAKPVEILHRLQTQTAVGVLFLMKDRESFQPDTIKSVAVEDQHCFL